MSQFSRSYYDPDHPAWSRPKSASTSGPIRVQRSRAKGSKMPNNTVYVGRGSKWGNPHKVGRSLESNGDGTYRFMTAEDAVARYRDHTLPYWRFKANYNILNVEELRGKNLACWCKAGEPCHADVLLELANTPALFPQDGKVE